MKIENNLITAEEGKILRRISDQMEFGESIHLGMTYYLNGELLSVPLRELPEHFEEIDKPPIIEIIEDENPLKPPIDFDDAEVIENI